MGKDYADHIRNKALLSYNSAWSTEKLTEYLAEEILRKERLEWLKGVVEEVLGSLNSLEKDMVAIRYFGKRSLLPSVMDCINQQRGSDGKTAKKSALKEEQNKKGREYKAGERAYFRKQQRLEDKLSGMLKEKGLTKEVYQTQFAALDIFEKIHRFVEEGKDKNRCLHERRYM